MGESGRTSGTDLPGRTGESLMRCLVISDGRTETAHPLPAVSATIGSSLDNDICVRVSGVSREHAVVLQDEGSFILRDLGSRNGIYVNGEKVTEIELTEERRVRIGRATLSISERSTADVIVGVEIDGDYPSTDKTEDEIHRSGTSPASRAVALIRQIESGSAVTELGRLEPEVLHLLECENLLVWRRSGDSTTIELSLGALPDDDTLEQLELELSVRRDLGGTSLIRAGKRFFLVTPVALKKQQIHLVCERSPTAPLQQWQSDFLSYLASTLSKKSRPERPSSRHTPEPSVLKLPAGIVRGSSPVINSLFREIEATISSDLDVLIWGETGVGKEHIARLLHESGPSSSGPFLAINCAAIPRDLLEAELFGVRKNVATGVEPRKGLFLEAHGGTLFLDEISEMEPRLQAKLLRAMQEREVLPIGATRPEPFEVRVVSSTNRDLRTLVDQGSFRDDLFYRLRGLTFHVPPLRERMEDLPQLVLHFATQAAEKNGKVISGITRRAISVLRSHSWPGNIRELKLEVERAVLMARDGGPIGAEHFDTARWSASRERDSIPGATSEEPTLPPGTTETAGLPLQQQVDALERRAILDALSQTAGNKSAAARMLGITRNGLSLKIKRLGIEA